VAQGDGGGLALLLVAGADLLPLLVGHQRQVDHAGEGAFVEFDGARMSIIGTSSRNSCFRSVQSGRIKSPRLRGSVAPPARRSAPVQAQFGGHGQELGFAFRADRHQQATAGLRVAQQVLLIVAQAPILCP
jgi:hypothetical protein